MTQPPETADLACEEVVELITDYLEGALDAAMVGAVDAHLAQCPGCDAYLEQMRGTIAALGRVPAETLSEQARAELIAAFRGARGG
jgi:anti-sigma factor RsiW